LVDPAGHGQPGVRIFRVTHAGGGRHGKALVLDRDQDVPERLEELAQSLAQRKNEIVGTEGHEAPPLS
jgi:hypothetical protein